jgi:hypothetical protein
MNSAFRALALLLAPAFTAAAAVVESGTLDLRIPGAFDGGVVSTLDVSGVPGPIVRLEVGLTLAGDPLGANGDLYVILSSDDPAEPYSVLLNRVGRSATMTAGYGDSGMTVRFADDAPLGDIHTYRMTLNGSHAVPLAALSGTWSPSGREEDPELVLGTSPRTAPLSNFIGIDLNTRWTLYLVDLLDGADTRLVQWSLDFNPVAVPEIPAMPVVATIAMACFAGIRLRGRG